MSSAQPAATHLPAHFDFYHLGKVAKDTPLRRPDLEERDAFAFEILGEEERVWMIFTYGKGFDASTYAEMGNVLASRLADGMSVAASGARIGVSPPRPMSAVTTKRLLAGRAGIEPITYFHEAPHGRAELEVWIIKAPWEGASHV